MANIYEKITFNFVKELKSLRSSTYYLIQRSRNGFGVTQKFVIFYRIRVLKILGKKSFRYLDKHLDAKDYTWRVSYSFTWKNLLNSQ